MEGIPYRHVHPLPLLKNTGTDALDNVNAYDFSQAMNDLLTLWQNIPCFTAMIKLIFYKSNHRYSMEIRFL